MLCNIFRFCEVPYSNYKIFDIKTIQIEETIIRVLLRQRWKKIWVSPLSDNLDAMLREFEEITRIQTITKLYIKKNQVLTLIKNPMEAEFIDTFYIVEFLRNDRPTSISQLVSRPRKDFRNFIRDVNTLAEYIVTYIKTVDNRCVYPNVTPGFMNDQFEMDNLDKPVKLNQILHEFETKIISGNAHWNHINFRSYFSSRNFPSGALADLVVGSLFSVLCNWAMSPSGVEFELQMVDLYGKLLGFPDIFLTNSPNSTGCGVTLSATSEGVIMAMLTARELMFEKHATNRTERFDVHSRLVAYMSDQAHSCHERATKLANVECRILETDENGSLRGTTFEEAIERDLQDGKIPFFYSLSFGSTGVIAFDNLKEISGTCEKHDIWIHADLAYTSSVLICPEYRYIIEDIEKKR
nr:aromatic-L-amino-acid decarboxylase-like isoform X2 [Lepeophtheirus salmonis]